MAKTCSVIIMLLVKIYEPKRYHWAVGASGRLWQILSLYYYVNVLQVPMTLQSYFSASKKKKIGCYYIVLACLGSYRCRLFHAAATSDLAETRDSDWLHTVKHCRSFDVTCWQSIVVRRGVKVALIVLLGVVHLSSRRRFAEISHTVSCCTCPRSSCH